MEPDQLGRDPKSHAKWESQSYRRWLRNTMCFVCHARLNQEKPDYLTHHHRHSGGKNSRDQLLTSLCLKCHNEFHYNESAFRKKYNIDEAAWCSNIILNLGNYLNYLGGNPITTQIQGLADVVEANNIDSYWVRINALHEAILGKEDQV